MPTLQEILGEQPQQETGGVSLQEAQTDVRQEEARGGTDTRFRDIFGNILPSAGRVVRDIGAAVTSPIETAKGIGEVAVGGVQKLIPGQQSKEQAFDRITQFYKDRYGSLEAAKATLINDPVGAFLDMSAAFGGTGLTVRGASKLTVGSTARNTTRIANTLTKASNVTDPVLLSVRAARKGRKMIANKTKGPKESLSTRETVSIIREEIGLTPGDRANIAKSNVAGKLPEEWLYEKGIIGHGDDILNQVDDLGANTRIQVDRGLFDIKDRFTEGAKGVDSTKKILEIAEKQLLDVPGLEDELAIVRKLKAQPDFNLSEMNRVKRIADDMNGMFTKSNDPAAGFRAKGMRNLRDQLKTSIEDLAGERGFSNVKELNKTTQVSREIANKMRGREYARVAPSKLSRAQEVFTDIILGGFGAVVYSPIAGLGITVGRRLLMSSTFRVNFAKKLAKLSSGDKRVLFNAVDTKVFDNRATSIMKRVVEEAKRQPSVSAEALQLPQVGEEE